MFLISTIHWFSLGFHAFSIYHSLSQLASHVLTSPPRCPFFQEDGPLTFAAFRTTLVTCHWNAGKLLVFFFVWSNGTNLGKICDSHDMIYQKKICIYIYRNKNYIYILYEITYSICILSSGQLAEKWHKKKQKKHTSSYSCWITAQWWLFKKNIGMDLHTMSQQHSIFVHAMFSQTKLVANNKAWVPLNFCDQTCLWCRSLRRFLMHLQQGKSKELQAGTEQSTLRGINISHLWERKIIFKSAWEWDMLVPWRVFISISCCVWIAYSVANESRKMQWHEMYVPTRRCILSGISMLVYRRVGISAQETNDGPEFTTSCENPGRARLQNAVKQAKAIRVIHDLCIWMYYYLNNMFIDEYTSLTKCSEQVLPTNATCIYLQDSESPDAAPEA